MAAVVTTGGTEGGAGWEWVGRVTGAGAAGAGPVTGAGCTAGGGEEVRGGLREAGGGCPGTCAGAKGGEVMGVMDWPLGVTQVSNTSPPTLTMLGRWTEAGAVLGPGSRMLPRLISPKACCRLTEEADRDRPCPTATAGAAGKQNTARVSTSTNSGGPQKG